MGQRRIWDPTGCFTPERGLVSTSPLRRKALVAGLAGALGWAGAEGSRFPTETVASLDIRIHELWRFRFDEETGDAVVAAAAWEDGTIWLAADNGRTLWELDADGRSLRVVHEDLEIAANLGSSALAMAPARGMLFLDRHGIMLFRSRSDPGAVIDSMDRRAVRGFAAFKNGDYVVSHGQWPDDPHADYAVHRYDIEGRHVASWHPALSYPEWGDLEWKAVWRMSGGPVAVTETGDLLVSDLAPFRITRYIGGSGDSSAVVVQDESILSSAEIDRSLPSVGTYSGDGSYSMFVDEMSDGNILNTLVIKRRSLFRTRRHVQWVVVSPGGEVLAQKETEYAVVADTGRGTYLAEMPGGVLVKLAVSIEESSP